MSATAMFISFVIWGFIVGMALCLILRTLEEIKKWMHTIELRILFLYANPESQKEYLEAKNHVMYDDDGKESEDRPGKDYFSGNSEKWGPQ